MFYHRMRIRPSVTTLLWRETVTLHIGKCVNSTPFDRRLMPKIMAWNLNLSFFIMPLCSLEKADKNKGIFTWASCQMDASQLLVILYELLNMRKVSGWINPETYIIAMMNIFPSLYYYPFKNVLNSYLFLKHSRTWNDREHPLILIYFLFILHTKAISLNPSFFEIARVHSHIITKRLSVMTFYSI